MHERYIKNIDLNLLIALKALLEEKHISRAAEKIGLSQPAMSRALGRLRKVFQDPILVRSQGGMILSSRANEFITPLKSIFNSIQEIIHPPVFDPLKIKKEIVVAIRDNELVILMPKVIAEIFNKAPGITFRIISPSSDNFSQLDRQEVDFIISSENTNFETLFRQVLYQETFSCVVSTKNKLAHIKKFNMKTYLSMNHCIVTTTGYGPGIVGRILAKQRIKRKVVVQLSSYLAAGHIIDENLVMTAPKRIASLLASQHKLKLIEPPFQTGNFPVYLYWHAKNQFNPIHKMLRDIFNKTAKNL